MSDEARVVAQMGLLLTQVTGARRALEDVQRSTARYAGLALELGGAGGIGQPPLQDGALKVYVANIADLAAVGRVGLFEDLLGGIGRFIGGLIGGAVGGAVGGFALAWTVGRLASFGESLRHIVQRVTDIIPGVRAIIADVKAIMGPPRDRPPEPAAANADAAASAAPARSGMAEITELLTGATTTPSTEPPWVRTLREGRRLVDGLVLLVPMVTGAIMSLFARLPRFQLAIADLLAFVVENLLVLRGVVLVTVFDTVAMAATLAASIVRAIGTAMGQIVTSLGALVSEAVTMVVEVTRFFGTGIKEAADALLDWLYDGLGGFLVWLGSTRVFRLIIHVVQILPDLMPALAAAAGRPLAAGGAELEGLERIRGRALPGPGATLPRRAGRPRLASPAVPFTTGSDELIVRLALARTTVARELEATFAAADRLLREVGTRARAQLTDADFNRRLDDQIGIAVGHGTRLREALGRSLPQPTASDGLFAIAHEYERFLTHGGMDRLMDAMTRHFLDVTPAGPAGATSMLGRLVDAVEGGLTAVTVEVREMVVEVAAGAGPTAAADTDASATGRWTWEQDVLRRGGSPSDPALAPV